MQLQTELVGYGIKATLPISSKTTGVLFCKICQQIRHSTAIVSELTTLNRNVIFEHGFAIGIGCRGIIARNKNNTAHSILDALKDIERIDYENIDQVASHIASLGTEDELEIRPDREGNPKLLGEWDLSEHPIKRNQICFLKAGQPNTDPIKRLERTIRQSKFDHVTIDPNEYTSHQLFDYARQIKQSYAVVGHFVTDENKHHDELNALTALLLGLAVGFGKRIAVFQELPISHQMIDLGGVLHQYSTLEELQKQLEQYLPDWQDSAKKEEEAHRDTKKRRIVQRAVLDIGDPAAEADDLLSDAFLHTQYAQWAQDGQKFLIVGPKGAGKTAICKYLEEFAETSGKSRSIFLEFTAFEIRRLTEAASLTAGRVHPDLLFRAFWRSNLIIEISLAFLKDAGTGYRTSDEFQALNRWVGDLELDDSTDYFDRFLRVAAISEDALHTITNEKFQALRFNGPEKLLKELLQGWTFFLYADRLDESWEMGSDVHKGYLRAFVHECFLLSNSFRRCVRPVLFIRKDVLVDLQQGEQEADKWSIGLIEWTRQELVVLLENRIKAGIVSEDEFSWDAVLPQALKGQRTIDYLLDRTFLRPRDAIVLLQWVINYAQGEEGLPASEPVVRRALKTFAENRLANLEREVALDVPKLAEMIYSALPFFGESLLVCEDLVGRHLDDAGFGAQAVDRLYLAGAICFVDKEDHIMSVHGHPVGLARGYARQGSRIESSEKRGFLGLLSKKVEKEVRSPLITLHPALHGLLDRLSEPVVFRMDAPVCD